MVAMPQLFPVTCHTDFVGHGSTFVAIQGYSDNGVKYIKTAIDKGATSVIVQKNVMLDDDIRNYAVKHNVTIEYVEDVRKALADLSAKAAGYPAKKLNIIGVTGTKGKTTTSFLLEYCLRFAGYKTGLISSVGNMINGAMLPPSLTTPQPDYLHQFLKLCVEGGVEYVVMEVAAQALTLHRVKDIQCKGVIFTNFSHEHLEFYSSLDEYFQAKCRIFDMLHERAPLVINGDDEYAHRIVHNNSEKRIVRYGFDMHDTVVDYKGLYAEKEQSFLLREQKLKCSTLFGRYNGYNMLAAATMANQLGLSLATIAAAYDMFPGIPGRLQTVELANGARAIIDYAHNPSSFEAVLSTLRLLTDNLIVVFGAGGGRDKIKRPVMGGIASHYADHVILTTDNPRLENPEDIIADIGGGVDVHNHHKVTCVLDRTQAIHQAYEYSDKGSIIAILGKGPDEYQIIGTIKHPFSEQTILRQLM